MDLSKHLEKAAEAVKRRNYPFAVNLYGQLIALQPDNGEARAGLRLALFKKAEQKPPSKLFAMLGGGLPLMMAGMSRMIGQHKSAAKGYERYLAQDPLNERVNMRLAEALTKAGFKAAALAVYKSYAEHQPRCLQATREAGLLLYETGQNDEALEMLELALKVDPRDQEALRARKNLAAEGALKKTGLADAGSSRDLIKDKGEQRKLEKSSRLQLSPEEIEEELQELEAELADGADLKTLMRVGKLHEMRNDAQSALDFYEQALGMDRDNSDLANRVGDMRLSLQADRVKQALDRGDENATKFAQKALDEARVGEFKRRVEQNPTDFSLRFDLGQAMLACGQFDESIAELQLAIKEPKRKADSLLLLGRAFRAKDLGDVARGQLEKALDAAVGRNTLSKEILYELGGVHEQDGDKPAALEHYARILEQDIGFRDVAAKVEQLKSS